MRHVPATFLSAVLVCGSIGDPAGAVTRAQAGPIREMPNSAPWAPDRQDVGGQAWGFAPLSVTQSGVSYSPVSPASVVADRDPSDLSDLPVWAIPGDGVRRAVASGMMRDGSGRLPEPTTWALMLVGFAMIGGALRGLIMANRRLSRLQTEEDA